MAIKMSFNNKRKVVQYLVYTHTNKDSFKLMNCGFWIDFYTSLNR